MQRPPVGCRPWPGGRPSFAGGSVRRASSPWRGPGFPLAWLLLACLTACTARPHPTPPAPRPQAEQPIAPPLTATPARLPTRTPVPGVLYVDAATSLGPVSRLSFGTNCGPWMGVPVDLIDRFRASGLTLLRFPGGNWGDLNDLEAYQIDQFIALAGQIQAEPLIAVRLRGGTPAKAADLVRYVKQRGYPVRYWSIGNEPSLYASREPGYDTVRHNQEWRAFATAMRAVDPAIVLVGPDIHQFTGHPATDPKDAAGRDWLREFLRANGDLVGVVSIHRYPFPRRTGDPPPTLAELLADCDDWDGLVHALRLAVREAAGRDLPVAVTEFNSHWANVTGTDTTPDSFGSALWLADVLGRLVRARVDMVAHFALQSGPRAGGYGLLATSEVRPSYYVYQMYRHLGQELVYASSGEPRLTILAARRPDATLTLMVINRGPRAAVPVRLDHFLPSGRAEVRLFDATHPAEALPPVEVSASFSYDFPPLSVTLLAIPQQ